MSNFLFTDSGPLIISLDRHWIVPDNKPNGSLIATVRVSGPLPPEDEYKFGLEHSSGFNIVESSSEPLPFFIDPATGEVRTNQSLSKLVRYDLKTKIKILDAVTVGHL